MHFSVLLVTVLVTCAIQTHGSTARTERQFSKIEKRQATNNADQMVQNILEWLQGVYAQNSRRIRQGTLRTYLPPPNSEKPRPFQTGYPPAKYYPEPPFPFPTSPVTGGVTGPDDNLLPPELGSGGGESGYTGPEGPGLTISTEGGLLPGGPTTSLPTSDNGEQPAGGLFPTHAAGIPEAPSTTLQPGGIPEGGPTTTLQPGYPAHAGGISEGGPTPTTLQPGYPSHAGGISEGGPTTTLQPGYPSHAGGIPEGGPITTGYPTHAGGIPEGGPTTTLQPGYPSHAGGVPEGGPITTGYPTHGERIPEGGPTTTLQPGYPSHAGGTPEGGPTTTLQPGYPSHAGGIPEGGPITTGYPTHGGGIPEGGPTTTLQPGYPSHAGEIPEGGPSTTLQPGYPTHAGGIPEGAPTTTLQPGYQTHAGGVPEGTTTLQPGYPTHAAGLRTTEQPATAGVHEGGPTSEQPVFPTHAAGLPTTKQPEEEVPTGVEGASTTANLIPEGTGVGVSIHTGIQTTSQPEGSVGPDHAQPSIAPEGTSQPSHEGTTAAGLPESTPGVHYSLQPGDQTGTSLQPGPEAGSTHSPQEIPAGEETPAPVPEGTPSASEGTPGSEPVPEEPSAGPSTLVPSGFTTSTTEAPSETEKAGEDVLSVTNQDTTISPEANTIPGKTSPIDDDDLKHPPHIHAIDVQCGKERMTINIEFNREFNGVIYSKGFFNTPECRYVQENSGQTKYTFTVNLDMCGTQFVNGFDSENQSYLENVLVLQNEAGIQEVWDTVRSVRCLWEGNLKDSLSVALSVDMLSQEIVTFSGDTAMAKLDVVLGRGPFGEPANGLVKIGEQMTLVVSVTGDPAFDLQVKDCRAVDAENKNTIALTDEDGCVLKPKLFGAFQKTKETGDSGASIIAYAYLNAFKFPDQMDLMIECNIELCKNDCDMCTKEDQVLEPSKRRKRRDVSNSTITGDWVTMGKLVRVILPEELNKQTALEVTARDHICMSIQGFVFSTAILVSLLVLSSFTCVCLWMKRKEKVYLKY
ncbi:unnamed protein product [Ceutorhynchus assimilis]|uniref:ZP domain-containing protein n=1 Tax=Ceutorhynchus assimilis TaxID=467358 RepID=A0A9N9QPD6_9CUCU|nr:unnamed protein product [Ceutorhynchus assimilis]